MHHFASLMPALGPRADINPAVQRALTESWLEGSPMRRRKFITPLGGAATQPTRKWAELNKLKAESGGQPEPPQEKRLFVMVITFPTGRPG
jgi:hypothetical protein